MNCLEIRAQLEELSQLGQFLRVRDGAGAGGEFEEGDLPYVATQMGVIYERANDGKRWMVVDA